MIELYLLLLNGWIVLIIGFCIKYTWYASLWRIVFQKQQQNINDTENVDSGPLAEASGPLS